MRRLQARLEDLERRIAADDRRDDVAIDARVLVVVDDGETIGPDPSRLTLEGDAAEAVLRIMEEATGEHPATAGQVGARADHTNG